MNNRLFSVFAIAAIVLLNACSDDEKKLPANVIQDADGVEIELTWDTGGSAAQALEDADLELFIYRSDDEDMDMPVGGSVNFDDFEELDLDDDYDDDEYSIVVELFWNHADVDVDFVVKVTGGDKDFEADGTFSSTDLDGTVATVLTITKKGNKYTVEEED